MDDYERTFGSREISGVVQTLADDSRDKFMTDLFKRGQYQNPWDPNHVEWDDERFSRQLSPVVGMQSPSPAAKITKRLNKSMSCFRVAEHVVIPASRLFHERFGGTLLPDARGVVDRQLENLQKKVMRTVEKLLVDSLLGEVLVNSSTYPGATIIDDVVFPVSKLSAATSWATDTTKISSVEVKKIVDFYRKKVNRIPGTAILNSTTHGYLVANKEIQDLGKQPLQAANIILTEKYGEDAVLNGLRVGGLEWHQHLGTYCSGGDDSIDEGGTANEFVPDDTIIVLPPESGLYDTLGFAEASVIVPAKLWSQNPDDGFERAAPGFASYCEYSSSPLGVKVFVEWIGCGFLRFPQSVLVFTTHP